MEQKEIYLLIISASLTALILIISLLILFLSYQKRKEKYNREITQTRIEIKEQTLKNIAWEIHDNIGQILSTLNLSSYKILEEAQPELKPKVEEMQELIQVVIKEVRNLSKGLNTDYIKNVGLIKSVELELQRFDRLKFLKTEFKVEGSPFLILDDKEVILLRIIQEFLSNSLKHARATQLSTVFMFSRKKLEIIIEDNGIGYDETATVGTGVINMKNRAKLIGAFLKLESELNKGTKLSITYHKKPSDHVT